MKQITAKVKKPVCIPKLATYHGNINALRVLVAQFEKVAMDMARPRILVGKISPVSTQMTAQIERATQAM